MDGKTHMVIILGSEIPGNHDTCAHGNTVEEADHHVNQTTGGADCGQGIITQEIADYPGVEGVIQLLKNIAQKNRQGKEDHLFPDRSFCQRIRTDTHRKNTSFFKKLQPQQICYTPTGEKCQ